MKTREKLGIALFFAPLVATLLWVVSMAGLVKVLILLGIGAVLVVWIASVEYLIRDDEA